jgi:hypothetical protein
MPLTRAAPTIGHHVVVEQTSDSDIHRSDQTSTMIGSESTTLENHLHELADELFVVTCLWLGVSVLVLQQMYANTSVTENFFSARGPTLQPIYIINKTITLHHTIHTSPTQQIASSHTELCLTARMCLQWLAVAPSGSPSEEFEIRRQIAQSTVSVIHPPPCSLTTAH